MSDRTKIATVEFAEGAEVNDYSNLLDEAIDEREWFETESNEDGSYTVYRIN